MNRMIKGRFFDKPLNKMVYRSLQPYDCDHPDIEVMQYTGLSDSKGVEIYEGDILTSMGTDICVVRWVNQLACFMLENINPTKDFDKILFELHRAYQNRKVIGNIYEHSYLLK